MIRSLAACLLAAILPSVLLAQGFTLPEAVKRMTVADDLRISRVASEPEIRQPLSITFDGKGRMWVVQYLQYPTPAELKIVYQGDGLPARFRDAYIAANLLSNCLYWHEITPKGSSFTARTAGDFLTANGRGFPRRRANLSFPWKSENNPCHRPPGGVSSPRQSQIRRCMHGHSSYSGWKLSGIFPPDWCNGFVAPGRCCAAGVRPARAVRQDERDRKTQRPIKHDGR
jgi:hypothetical protein